MIDLPIRQSNSKKLALIVRSELILPNSKKYMNQPNHALPRAGKPIFSQTKIESETEKRRQPKNIYQAEEPVAVGTTLGSKCV